MRHLIVLLTLPKRLLISKMPDLRQYDPGDAVTAQFALSQARYGEEVALLWHLCKLAGIDARHAYEAAYRRLHPHEQAIVRRELARFAEVTA